MSSPPKRDAWRPYRPDQQRCVFVRQLGKLKPALGYVVTWPEKPGGRFLVAWWDDQQATPSIRVSWLDRRRVEPIWVDPNWLDH